MASASPSEFLTFYRRAATSQTLRRAAISRPFVARSFQTSSAVRATGDSSHKEHATRKEDRLDVQSRGAKQGQESKSTDTGGAATREKDEKSGVSKAKQEFPEAPDPAIGMQDERGGKN